jgi:glycosyltransferase involved in cell wall biosynthesis
MTRGYKAADKVFVVRSGPKLDIFQPVPADPVYKNGRNFLVGYLGVMGEFDGVDHLVRAAHELIVNRGRTDIAFCLVGSGPMLQSLKNLAGELGIAAYLEFPGRISDQEMIARICSCDVCVDCDPLNPLNDKSTMNKVLEYMALERPIVQYDLVEGKRSALDASVYAEPNNVKDLATKIEDLLANPAARAEMGAYGRKRMIDELEWKHQVPKLLEAYAVALK